MQRDCSTRSMVSYFSGVFFGVFETFRTSLLLFEILYVIFEAVLSYGKK